MFLNLQEGGDVGKRTGRAASRCVDYNFSEYDNLIKDALSASNGAKVNT